MKTPYQLAIAAFLIVPVALGAAAIAASTPVAPAAPVVRLAPLVVVGHRNTPIVRLETLTIVGHRDATGAAASLANAVVPALRPRLTAL
jgi:hypothetical protein